MNFKIELRLFFSINVLLNELLLRFQVNQLHIVYHLNKLYIHLFSSACLIANNAKIGLQ